MALADRAMAAAAVGEPHHDPWLLRWSFSPCHGGLTRTPAPLASARSWGFRAVKGGMRGYTTAERVGS